LSPAVASPCLSEIKVHSHRAQEQESSKIEKYDTAPITKPPQAQDRRDTSDNSNNNLLSLPDSDDNPGNESDLSNHNRAYNRVSDAFNGDIEDTSAHDNDADADSSGNDENVAYDPGGVSKDSTLDGATQDSADDTTDDSSPSSTHTPLVFDNDAADSRHSDDRRRDTGLDTDNSSDDIIRKLPFDTDAADSHDADDRRRDTVLNTTISDDASSDDSRIVYDPGGIGFSKDSALGGINDGDGSSLPYDPGGDTNDESDVHNFVYDPGGDPFIHTTRKRNATASTAHDFDLVPCYELAQAVHLVFNAAPPSSTGDHPFLVDARHTAATSHQVIQDVATAAATSKRSEVGLTGDGQDFDPPGDVRSVCALGLEQAQHPPLVV